MSPDSSPPSSGDVSTHSRPKAAEFFELAALTVYFVSTHSRPKAADGGMSLQAGKAQFQHTAARRRLIAGKPAGRCAGGVSTHSRPKAADGAGNINATRDGVSTHSRPKAAELHLQFKLTFQRFQHTAARRRLTGHPSINELCRCRFNTQPPEGG